MEAFVDIILNYIFMNLKRSFYFLIQAMFIPSAEPHDTSYFMSRYIWNPEDEDFNGASDFDDHDLTDTSSSSFSNLQDEDVSLHYNSSP